MISAIAGLISVGAGFYGFRLVPDSYTYARGALSPSLIGTLTGRVGGMTLLILVGGAAAAACVALLPDRRSRLIWLGFSTYWFAFPGVDALGVLMVALMLRTASPGKWWLLAWFAHPVAALVTWPLLRPGRWTLELVALSAVAAIVGVGVYDSFSSTTRYLLPVAYLWTLGTVGARRVGSPLFGEGTATRPGYAPSLGER